MTQGYPGNPFDAPTGGDPFGGGPVTAPPPPSPGPVPDRGEVNTLATLSMVFAFVFAPAGAILGHLGLAQVARTGQRGRERALSGITLSYVVMTTVIVGLVVWAAGGNESPTPAFAADPSTTSVAAPPPRTTDVPAPTPKPRPTLEPTALQGILLNVDDLRALLTRPALAPIWTTSGLGLQPDRGGFEDTSCAGSHFKGTPMAYGGHVPLQFTGTDIGDRSTGLLIGQGAAVFPDAAAAQQAFTAYVGYLRGCAGKSTMTIPTTPTADGLSLTYGMPVEIGNDMVKVDTKVEGGTPGGEFSHYLAVKNNVVVDSIFIGLGLADTPTRVMQAMLDRVPN
ncbi:MULTISPECIES: sensor domain-containing protein [Mycobacteriaceae]|uniref:sensor domain-containing protein n=1 Tax=Mycobacteriaceae TaxID=1762 RepID=UPI000686F6E3|nr:MULTISPECIES: sensor domain-containing protein [Mycobacteriaceae]AXK76917.1 DUF4190 domain-containing protein [Mycolicibacterium neoaurum]KUM10338.1 hypothetical protein AVZ31_01280 [Mycolicibacterium neoaurum]